MKTFLRMLAIGGLVFPAFGLFSPAQAADNYPSKPVRLVVAFAPGGPADIVTRLIQQGMQEALKTPIIVENRAGAGGNIVSELVAKSAADGYTLLVNTTAFAVNPTLYSNPGYDAEKDFVPVVIIATQPNTISVNQSLGINTLAELQALVKKEKRAFASPGSGTTPHLTGAHLFNILWKADVTHVPFRGAGPAAAAVYAGEPPIASTAVAAVLSFHKQGRVRILAVSSEKRIPALPNVPTLDELGYPQIKDYTWVALFAPAGTPAAVVQRLNDAVNKVVAMPDVREKLDQQALTVVGGSPAQAADYVKLELRRWGEVVKATNAKAE